MKARTIRAKFGDKVTVGRDIGIRLDIMQKWSIQPNRTMAVRLTPAGARRIATALLAAANEEEGT